MGPVFIQKKKSKKNPSFALLRNEPIDFGQIGLKMAKIDIGLEKIFKCLPLDVRKYMEFKGKLY